MHVVIYYAGPHNTMYEKERFKHLSLTDAREVIREFYDIEVEHAEWNIRESWIASSGVEAHVYGYDPDEHVAIILEEKGKCDYLTEEWYV